MCNLVDWSPTCLTKRHYNSEGGRGRGGGRGPGVGCGWKMSRYIQHLSIAVSATLISLVISEDYDRGY